MRIQEVATITLSMTLVACSLQTPAPDSNSATESHCFRAGSEQQFDCSAPALQLNELRDPLAQTSRFTDEELMDLLAEIKRWLARRKLLLQGETIPPELLPKHSPVPVTTSTEENARLPRPWALILNDFSAESLQRSNSSQH
ncbi:hypothetical protein [Marinobacterium sediminicola]|uniref:Uncharacterized protein n=1 Tax=Marinobacterium sediminicola TaxID=518898 RepID=A0ABY1RZL7_9GAMM|nr:hypothetical protein [Marinobacterium sediminicola]ULG69939.1 hypothetical protein LN244_03775 [Marinobacterium sediminicola]SMR74389.1 hypothetical protein SAMN04487964_10635 [Marinobacterium sediminicola]